MEIVPLKATVNGKTVKVKNALNWGELRQVATAGDTKDGYKPLNSLDKLIELTVVEGFDVQNRTEMMQLDADEFTQVVGEIQKLIPLEKYLKNLNLEGAIFDPTKQ